MKRGVFMQGELAIFDLGEDEADIGHGETGQVRMLEISYGHHIHFEIPQNEAEQLARAILALPLLRPIQEATYAGGVDPSKFDHEPAKHFRGDAAFVAAEFALVGRIPEPKCGDPDCEECA